MFGVRVVAGLLSVGVQQRRVKVSPPASGELEETAQLSPGPRSAKVSPRSQARFPRAPLSQAGGGAR